MHDIKWIISKETASANESIASHRSHHTQKLRRYDKWSAKIMTLIRSHTLELKANRKKTIANSCSKSCSLAIYLANDADFLWHIVWHSESFVMEKMAFIRRTKSSQLCDVICSSVTAAPFGISLDCCNLQLHYFNECVALRAPSIGLRDFFFFKQILLIDKWWNKRWLSPHFWRCVCVCCCFVIFFVFFSFSHEINKLIERFTLWWTVIAKKQTHV